MSKTNEEKLAAKEAKTAKKVEKAAEKKEKQAAKKIKQQETKQKVLDVLGDMRTIVDSKADDAAIAMKKVSVIAVQKAEDFNAEVQRRTLRPVFDNDLRANSFPDMIRICEPDKQHLDSPVCQGSVGHIVPVKEMEVLNLYTDHAEDYGLTYYPSVGEDVYYRHPFKSNYYISIDDYFYQLKKERVDELNQIAQALGAKYCKITLLAEKKTFTGAKTKAALKGPRIQKEGKKSNPSDADFSAEYSYKDFRELEVSSECEFKGHYPKQPTLHYFLNEHDILTLINMRLNDHENDFYEQTYTLKVSNTSKIKAATALKIDAALKKLKILDGNATISGEIEEEGRLYYKYHIKFPMAEDLKK